MEKIRNKKILIHKPPRIDWIPFMFDRILKSNGFDSQIVTEIKIDGNDDEIYIIMCGFMLKQFPKKYIIYQLEQVGRFNGFTKEYLEAMNSALMILDYSKMNIRNLSEIIKKPINYQPMFINSEMINVNENNENYEHDILFYGTLNKRRIKIIKIIEKIFGNNFKVKIIDGLFGEKLFEHVKKSKIVLNIHFYESAVLETCRLNELLQYDNIVVSEMPDLEDENYDEYKNEVIFVEEINKNLNNICKLIDGIYVGLKSFENRNIKKRKEFLEKMEIISNNKFIENFMNNTYCS